MAIKALKLDSTESYVSRYDPAGETDEATRFQVGALDSRVMGYIRDKATKILVDPKAPTDSVETSVNAAEVNFLTVQFGLKGWTNFKDDGGNDIGFKTVAKFVAGKSYTVVSPEILSILPIPVVDELAERIRDRNSVDSISAGN